jgi:hypothetical protein
VEDVKIDVRQTVAGLELLAAGIHQAAHLALRAAMDVAVASAKGTTLYKDRSGETRKSVHAEMVGPMRGFVEAKGASRFLENGTPPHEIVARKAQALRFVVNGETIFRRMVRHPGTAERPFMRIARDEAQKAADYAAEFYVDFAMRKV